MNKKVLILSSSPRKGGNSDKLCDEFMRGALDAENVCEKVFLGGMDIHFCRGCGACQNNTMRCVQKDDATMIVDKMILADVIVLATPVYFYTMCAQLKMLIDRTCAKYTAITDKEFYFILTAADDSQSAMQRTVESLRGFTSCLSGARERGIVYGLGAWKVGEIDGNPAMRNAYDLGKKV